MISVTLAVDSGKPLFVAFHPFNDDTINNRLIRECSIPVEEGDHILYELGWCEN